MSKTITKIDPEFEAIPAVFDALQALERESQIRVIRYVATKLGVLDDLTDTVQRDTENLHTLQKDDSAAQTHVDDKFDEAVGDGINAIGHKWMRRNSFTSLQLSAIFSIGGDEIDLIAKSIPGGSKKQRMRNVLLLKGVAAYLGGGAARVSHDQLKETCLHYDAYDGPNFATHLKSFSSEASGTKQSGYTLTQRGLASATSIVKSMMSAKD